MKYRIYLKHLFFVLVIVMIPACQDAETMARERAEKQKKESHELIIKTKKLLGQGEKNIPEVLNKYLAANRSERKVMGEDRLSRRHYALALYDPPLSERQMVFYKKDDGAWGYLKKLKGNVVLKKTYNAKTVVILKNITGWGSGPSENYKIYIYEIVENKIALLGEFESDMLDHKGTLEIRQTFHYKFSDESKGGLPDIAVTQDNVKKEMDESLSKELKVNVTQFEYILRFDPLKKSYFKIN